MNKINNIPTIVYGCRVLLIGWPERREAQFSWGVAICVGKRTGYWLTICGEDWEPFNREFYDNLEIAKREAEQRYSVSWGSF